VLADYEDRLEAVEAVAALHLARGELAAAAAVVRRAVRVLGSDRLRATLSGPPDAHTRDRIGWNLGLVGAGIGLCGSATTSIAMSRAASHAPGWRQP
jgi:hypothetical protein